VSTLIVFFVDTGGIMPASRLLTLILSCLVAAAQAYAADEPAKQQKSGSSKIERAADKTHSALKKAADSTERGLKRALTATEKGINTAGKKTGDWLNEKTK
jgi:hypothetical protein